MDIIALGDGKFGIGMMLGRFEHKWNKDGTLSVWSKEPAHAQITTNRGVFIEVLDTKGNVVHEGGDGDWMYVDIAKKPVTLRYKTLPDPTLTKAQIDKARQKVTRYLVTDKPYSLDIPGTLPGAIKWMQKQLTAIPETCRKATRFEFGTTTEYGETYPQIEITYTEPESDAEVICRTQIEAERARIKEACERHKLRKLKNKYETV